MSIGDAEIKTQERVIRFFKDPEILGYQYIGNLSDYQNKNIKEDRLRQYLRLKGYADKLIDAAIMQLQQEAGNLSRGVYDANKTVYSRLKYGIPVSESPEKPPVTVQLVDEEKPLNNDFAIAEEVTVVEQSEKRPDLVVYLNGIAVAVIELKRSSISVSEGIRQNLTNQKNSFIQSFFTTMQFCMAGNESEGLRYGTLLTERSFIWSGRMTDSKNMRKSVIR
jgi:type I restriction enzyme R subunit